MGRLGSKVNLNTGSLGTAVSTAISDANLASQSDLTSALAGKADAADLSSLSSTVAGKADATDLSSLSSTVAGKADAGDVSSLSSTVSSLSSTVAGKADASDVSTLSSSVSTLSSSVAGKADAADVTAVANAVKSGIGYPFKLAPTDITGGGVDAFQSLTPPSSDVALVDGHKYRVEGSIFYREHGGSGHILGTSTMENVIFRYVVPTVWSAQGYGLTAIVTNSGHTWVAFGGATGADVPGVSGAWTDFASSALAQVWMTVDPGAVSYAEGDADGGGFLNSDFYGTRPDDLPVLAVSGSSIPDAPAGSTIAIGHKPVNSASITLEADLLFADLGAN